MPYLKAVVLEGLRRHPLSHFLVPHAVIKDFELDGFLVPKNCIIEFLALTAPIGKCMKQEQRELLFQLSLV